MRRYGDSMSCWKDRLKNSSFSNVIMVLFASIPRARLILCGMLGENAWRDPFSNLWGSEECSHIYYPTLGYNKTIWMHSQKFISIGHRAYLLLFRWRSKKLSFCKLCNCTSRDWMPHKRRKTTDASFNHKERRRPRTRMCGRHSRHTSRKSTFLAKGLSFVFFHVWVIASLCTHVEFMHDSL